MEEYILKVNEDNTTIKVSDVHKVLLEMLKDIDTVLRKHNIPYFLNGGSALGAFRHEGFIPWDDDADIAMMLDDYKKFLTIIKTELKDKYVIHCFEENKKYNVLIPAMKIRKKNTMIKEVNSLLPNRCEDCDGIFVDVFVYDYCTKNKFIDLPFRILNQMIMPLLIILDMVKINPIFLKRWFLSNARIYGQINKNSDLIGFDLTWTFKSPFKPFIFKKSDIYPVKYVKFEDTMLPVANNIHEYLCVAIAPSYNTLPPKDKRAPKHIKDIKL
ncbi:MAG: phosphorylcholine transferase LicD [Anaerorhabdus sp.]